MGKRFPNNHAACRCSKAHPGLDGHGHFGCCFCVSAPPMGSADLLLLLLSKLCSGKACQAPAMTALQLSRIDCTALAVGTDYYLCSTSRDCSGKRSRRGLSIRN